MPHDCLGSRLPDNTKIWIGAKGAKNLFPEDIKYLDGSDGFAVRQKDKNIYIFG